jgi:hypothetical protein
MWWLITWTTYGSWLPGDPRGFRTRDAKEYVPPPRRYAGRGEVAYDKSQYAYRHDEAMARSDESVMLTAEQQRLVRDAVVAEIDAIPIVSAIASFGATHVHWLARFDHQSIRPTVGRIKSASTRALNTAGFDGKRPWSKNCHMQSKPTEREFHGAFRYIQRHVDESCLIHIWSPYQADGSPSVP